MLHISWNHVPKWLIGIGLTSVALVFVVQMWRGEAVMCADGTLFAKTCTSTAAGLVAAFDRADLNEDTCPEGWEPFVDGRGRVIVGAGNPSASTGQLGVDEAGDPLTSRSLRQHGGAEKHTLSKDEMAAHSHRIDGFEWGYSVNGNGDAARIDVDDGAPWEGHKGTLHTSKEGPGDAHNNMPPYIALYLCKKK